LLPAATEFSAADPLRRIGEPPPGRPQLASRRKDFVIRSGGAFVTAKELGFHA
jgi:hypothetical protein